MQIVLLERVEKLGQMGDVVNVKDGYARNFLLPQKKALRATEANINHFETQRAQLEARNLEQKTEAQAVCDKLDGTSVIILRQSGETGILYGSANSRDIAAALTEAGFSTERHQVVLDRQIKMLGLHDVRIVLHPEVHATVTVNIARTEEEAEQQAAGVDVFAIDEDEDLLDLEEIFEDVEAAEAALGEAPEAEEFAEPEQPAGEAETEPPA